MSASPTRTSTSSSPIRSTTRRDPDEDGRLLSTRRLSTTIRRIRPASVRPASSSIATAATASINGYVAVKFQGAQARLRAVPATRQMPAHIRTRRQTRQVVLLLRQSRPGTRRMLHRSDEAAIDSARGPGAVWRDASPPSSRCSATSAHNKRLNRFTLRGQEESRYAVEALLPGAQHREAGAPRVCAVGSQEPADPRQTPCRRLETKVSAGGAALRSIQRQNAKAARRIRSRWVICAL